MKRKKLELMEKMNNKKLDCRLNVEFDEYAQQERLSLADLIFLFDGYLRQGKNGMYVVTESKITIEDVDVESLNLVAGEEIVLLDTKEELTLPLPCTPKELVAWAEATAGDFVLPEVFVLATCSKTEKQAMATIDKEKKCQEWLVGMMQNSQLKKKIKAEYKLEAQDKYGIGIKAFNRAWSSAIERTNNVAWLRAGRPKKK